jgi:predicted permease
MAGLRRPWIEIAAKDLHFAFRQACKAPGFALSTVLTLTLGIGTALAMFAIVYGVLLQPLPFPNARQLVQPIAIDAKGEEDFGAPYANIQQWQSALQQSAEIAYSNDTLGILDTPAGALLVSNISGSSNLLPMLGVQPMIGRGFLAEEQKDERSQVALLSYGLWREAFGGDRNVLGKAVHIAGEPYIVVGVMPPRFEYPLDEPRAEVWTPLAESKLLPSNVPNFYGTFHPILRVNDSPHSGEMQAGEIQALLSTVQERIARAAKPGTEVAERVRLVSLRDSTVADARPALTALEIAVALVWLIACCNVAGLLLARIAARRTEIAVRDALGAGRMRIVCQFLTESLLLSATGAACGLGLAMLILQSFRHMLEKTLPLAKNIHLSWPACATLVGLTLLTGFVFGLFPALVAARMPMEQGLKSGGRTAGANRDQNRVRGLLMTSEIALSLVLLVGAGLMMRTIYSLRHVPLGFRTDHIVLTDLTAPGYAYSGRNINTAAWNPLLDRVRQLPGVQSSALSTVMPIRHPVELLTVVYATPWTKTDVGAAVRAASPELMRVLGIQMRAGRFFTANDTADSMPVAVVNQTFADRFLGGNDPVGKQIRFGRVAQSATIVGVLQDVHQLAIAAPSEPEFYVCMSQLKPDSALYPALIGRYIQLAVRTQTDPGAIIPELRSAIHDENPNLAVGNFITMDQAMEDSIGGQRLAAEVIGTFGCLALLITIVGLYGLLSYAVAQRTQEIGIRMALGADRSRVTRMVMGQALVLLGAGVVAGLALAIWSSRLLHSLLYGVQQHDAWTLVLAPGVLVLFGGIAAFIPARRAASIDPMRALRTE